LNHQNNYVGRSSRVLECQNFAAFIMLESSLRYYFDSPIKLFSDLYLNFLQQNRSFYHKEIIRRFKRIAIYNLQIFFFEFF